MRILHWSPALILIIWFGCAVFVHFRGKVKLRFMRQLGDHSTFLAPYNLFVYLFSKVPNKPILDINGFPELLALRNNWETIRDEARRLYEEGHIKKSDTHSDLAFNSFFKRGWKRFYLKWYDDMMPSAMDLCPKTVELVKSIPSVNAALFAMLPGRSKLGAHRDPFAGSIRYHLGLITPNKDECRIFIDGDPYSWRDGQDVLFDETFIHSVRNDTDDARIILFCDVMRPMRYGFAQAINTFVCQHIVKISQAQNSPTEKVGALNRISKYIFGFREISERLGQRNRMLAKALNLGLTLAVVALLVLLVLRLRK
ncbi:MAG TPA: aspartyl/asparaginyl beta-hydroxylase domain-containing protein [Tepidisphaeraceae bacterium]|jgi:beta-hydroxylase|nr:aspartyl/asparaginyl beta-hydroxylase domain-containing protein [Tepidisphaeraceae bacterium]